MVVCHLSSNFFLKDVLNKVKILDKLPNMQTKQAKLTKRILAKRQPKLQAPVVQRVDSAIQWINYYPLDNAINFDSTYPLDSDLSNG